jgi:hypothetical protein
MKAKFLILAIFTLSSFTLFSQTLSFPWGQYIGTTGVTYKPIIKTSWDSATGDFVSFYTSGDLQGNLNEKMRLTYNGSLGVGATIPLAKLDVRGSVYIPTGNSYWIGAVSDAGNRLRLFHDGSNAYIDYAPNLYFRAGTQTVASLTSAGNLQVGVYNQWSKSKFSITSNGGPLLTEWDNHPFLIWSGVSQTDYSLFAGVSKESKCAYISATNCGVAWAPLALNMGGGLVTVGKVTDFTKASGYALAVAGNIIAEKVVVKLQGNWPDYVFGEKYKLRSLEDVEEFIKVNNHLPDVPCEDEVKEEGIDLAKMNAILVQKVEEISLYLIEQNKRLDALERENKELKIKNNL